MIHPVMRYMNRCHDCGISFESQGQPESICIQCAPTTTKPAIVMSDAEIEAYINEYYPDIFDPKASQTFNDIKYSLTRGLQPVHWDDWQTKRKYIYKPNVTQIDFHSESVHDCIVAENKPIGKPPADLTQRACTCDLKVLMNSGCKCGGT